MRAMNAMVEEGVEAALRMSAPLDEPVAKALEGAVFPLTRSEIIAVARENEASSRMLTLLSDIPNALFANLKELQEAFIVS